MTERQTTQPIVDRSYQKIVLDRISIRASREVSKLALMNTRLSVRKVQYGDMVEKMLVDMERYVLGLKHEIISVHHSCPATWWDAVKERFFPEWMLGRWPVRYKNIDIEQQIYRAVCPHLYTDPQEKHIEFLFTHDRASTKGI